MSKTVAVVALLAVLLLGCSGSGGVDGIDAGMLRAFAPLPDAVESDSNALTPAKVELGRLLYHDPRLSAGNDISCATCHPLDSFGADGKPVSPGHQGQPGTRNSPTVFNAAGHFVQFWDGRAATVEEQASGPILNPVEMAMPSAEAVETKLRADSYYREAFARAFPGEPEPVTFDNLARALGAFERTLVTPSRWDAFLQGDHATLTDKEIAGFARFTDAGCMTCHRGPYVGGDMYSRLGITKSWPDTEDLGRYEVTDHERDRLIFKVPGLRNVTETAPYLHDGSVANIEEAVRLMGDYQLGAELSDEDIRLIVVWLGTLTGELPES
jgi:cytochrome c peroxidase